MEQVTVIINSKIDDIDNEMLILPHMSDEVNRVVSDINDSLDEELFDNFY